jgi:prepilin-type processing-associated H-X9-DG protein
LLQRKTEELTPSSRMPIPLDPRKKPTAVKVHVKTGSGVDITWADGHASHYEFSYLREECPCATCNDERGKNEAFAAAAPAANAFPALPMFKPKPRAQAANVVGNYAVQISFTDGHSTGIYSYDHLRSICPCAECAKAFRTAAP